LKFEGDWEQGWGEESEDEGENDSASGNEGGSESEGVRVERKRGRGNKRESTTKTGMGTERKGFMVSGSSDCSVCVWDLTTGQIVASSDADGTSSVQGEFEASTGAGSGSEDEPEREVNAEVRAVLKGHMGGVLDLRIDKRWIVSWYVDSLFCGSRFDVLFSPHSSKDAVIRVWDRLTLDLHRTLRGHEGPVNAVGLQSEKVVRIAFQDLCSEACFNVHVGQRKW
jgi:F-box and WD-40 domain protein 1/11